MRYYKIMPCVEGDISDCQPKGSSISRSLRLRAMVAVEGLQSDLSPSTYIGHDCFHYTESLSFTYLVYLCTVGTFVKRKK